MNYLRAAPLCFAVVIPLLLGSSGVSAGLRACPSHQSQFHHNCFGTYNYSDGSKYVGEFRDNRRNGQGTFSYPDGAFYVGEHRDNKFHGQGTFNFNNGAKYVGEHRGGLPNGQGTYTHPNGTIYVGEVRDGTWHGQGTYTFPNGAKYVGALRNGKFDGQGAFTHPDGRVEEGIWRNNELQSAQQFTPPEPPLDRRPPQTNSDPDNTKLVLVGAGSSFMISKIGHLLTNQHVIDSCQIVTIHLPLGLKKARVVATDDTNDLALLKIDLEDDNVIPISVTNASLLEDVIVAGYPLSGSLSTTVKVTKGVVSSLAGLGNDYSQIQIDAAIQPGNSGGPILNDQGNVVGVTVAALDKEYFLKEKGTIPENTNFGIKSSTARAFVDANGVKLPQPYSKPMSRSDMANLITKSTHLIGCWVSQETAQKMASSQKRELSVTPTMQRQVEALR